MAVTHTVQALIDQIATWYPKKAAFIQKGDTENTQCTYAEVRERARQWGQALSQLGVERGDRVAFLSRNCVDHAIAYLGVMYMGAIPAPLHVRESTETLREMMRNVDSTVLVFHSKYEGKASELADTDTDLNCIAFDDPSPPEFADSAADILADAADSEVEADVHAEDTAIINFTSGSTGVPKGVVHTHSDVVECAHLGSYLFEPKSNDMLIHLFTPSFIAWPNALFPFFATGASVLFVDEFDPEEVSDLVGSEDVSVLYSVPTQLKMLLQAGIGERDTSSVRLCGFGGETLSMDTINRIQDAITDDVFFEYGTTEVMHSGTCLHPHEMNEDTTGSVGRPLPGVDVRLITPNSNDPSETVDRGETGEVIVRGPSVADEIWDDPEKTDRLFHDDGWWFSGDLGRVDEHGNLNIVGRTDNMFKSGGIKVYAEKVEDILETNPDVMEAAVIGIPDETLGNVVKAFVIPEGSADEEMLDEWCLERDDLAGYQRPREYEFVGELPRTNTGKLNRAPLQENEKR